MPGAPTPDDAVPPIVFHFDFASGYAYFAAREIEALGARVGRRVLWRPYMLGTAFKLTGTQGLSSTPLKKEYAARDWARMARLKGVPFRLPPHHPSVALAATRAFYVIDAEDPALAVRFARAVLDGYFQDGLDSADPVAVGALAARLGLDAEAVMRTAATPAVKAQVKEISQQAVAEGVFGSPFFRVDGEPFWGWDRMAMMEQWIRQGGW